MSPQQEQRSEKFFQSNLFLKRSNLTDFKICFDELNRRKGIKGHQSQNVLKLFLLQSLIHLFSSDETSENTCFTSGDSVISISGA